MLNNEYLFVLLLGSHTRYTVSILRKQEVQTDGTIPNNKSNIIIRDNEKRTCMLIDFVTSGA